MSLAANHSQDLALGEVYLRKREQEDYPTISNAILSSSSLAAVGIQRRGTRTTSSPINYLIAIRSVGKLIGSRTTQLEASLSAESAESSVCRVGKGSTACVAIALSCRPKCPGVTCGEVV